MTRMVIMKRTLMKIVVFSCFIVMLTPINSSIESNIAVSEPDPLEIQRLADAETYCGSGSALETIYKNIHDMIEIADEIVIGEVVKARNIGYSSFPMTVSSFMVSRSIKGKVPRKSIIDVVEMGGELAGRGKFILDVPVMATGNRYCLFLFEDHDRYRIVGAFQGKFIIKSDYVFQQATMDTKLKNYTPLGESQFIDYIDYIGTLGRDQDETKEH